MKENEENILPQDKDRHLDIPAEARRDNNINFLEMEDSDNGNSNSNKRDDETKERQKQWKEGLEEGRKASENE